MLNYPTISMDEIQRLYRPGARHHWFDHSTMLYFSTVLPGNGVETPYGNFFITRETNPSGVSRFSIRRQDPGSGDIDTVGEFHAYDTTYSARAVLRRHLLELRASHDRA